MSGSLVSTDVLVIGGGLAGERAAIEAAAAGHKVLILSLVPPRRSHSCAAQGGMQASLGNCVKADGDNATLHFLDTVRGSDWGADQEVARIFAEEARIAVRELAHFGVPWTRVRGGKNSYFIKGERVEIEESIENDGLIMHRDFGGTAKWRACYAAAGTGHAVLYAVDSEVVKLGVEVRDRTEAVELIHDGSRCWGAVARCLRTGEHYPILAKATVIATGGYGRIYRPVHDQRHDQRGYGCGYRAQYRRRAAGQHGGRAVSSDRAYTERHPAHRGLPRRRRLPAQ
jgi:fumarate reductase flavoprotein subunit